MALYGTVARAKERVQAVSGDTWSAADDANFTEIQKWVSALIEEDTGMVFAASPSATVRVIDDVPAGTILYLPVGLRSVTSIVENPLTWNGSAWSSGTTLTTSDYRLAGLTQDGIYRTILAVDRHFGGRYVITGVWENQYDGVPDDITATANYAIAELFKKLKASPAGFTGPDGAVVPIRDVFKDTEVRKTLDKYRIGAGVWF